jgi:hypothetical protein
VLKPENRIISTPEAADIRAEINLMLYQNLIRHTRGLNERAGIRRLFIFN